MIIISPYSRKLRNGKRNAKDYPYWNELIKLINYDNIIQLGVDGETQLVKDFRKNLSLKEIKSLVIKCNFWISIDNFFPHLAHHVGKKGVVIWGYSDPNIFGYHDNLNLLKDRKYLRENQFDIWESCEFNPDVFLSPEKIYNEIMLSEYTILRTN